MAKKERIAIHRSHDLESIDLELDEALGRLDGANERISSLLQSIETKNVADEAKVYAEEGEEDDASNPSSSGESSDSTVDVADT